MTFRSFALTLCLGALTLSGCKTARPDDAYQARYTTTPPPGAVILPVAPPSAAPTETVQPPLASPPMRQP